MNFFSDGSPNQDYEIPEKWYFQLDLLIYFLLDILVFEKNFILIDLKSR